MIMMIMFTFKRPSVKALNALQKKQHEGRGGRGNKNNTNVSLIYIYVSQ